MSAQLGFSAIVALPPGVASDFDLFWSEYPRKVAKGAARKAFLTARRKASMAEIMAALLRYPWSADPQFIPHASTWLNGERYADEPGPDLAADAFGLGAWLAAQPPAEGLFSPAGYELEALTDILEAAGFAATWRGDLDTLGAWITAGYRPDSIWEVVAVAAAAMSAAPRSLRAFDWMVRRRAWRWNMRLGCWERER